MADHSLGGSIYGLKAVAAAGASTEVERRWQLSQLPDEVRTLVLSALDLRLNKRTGKSPDAPDR